MNHDEKPKDDKSPGPADPREDSNGENLPLEVDETAHLHEQVAALENELDTMKDRFKRAMADLDNYRKRTRKEIEDAVMRSTQDLLGSFLPTVDNLERALEAARDAGGSEQLLRGVEMVRDQFMAALQRHGIEPIASVGQPFDPAIHDALQQFDSPDHPPGVVLREFEKGFKLRERLLRPARVVVAGPGSTGK